MINKIHYNNSNIKNRTHLYILIIRSKYRYKQYLLMKENQEEEGQGIYDTNILYIYKTNLSLDK